MISVYLLAHRNRQSTQAKVLWTLMTALVGLPALVSFFLLNHIRGASIPVAKDKS